MCWRKLKDEWLAKTLIADDPDKLLRQLQISLKKEEPWMETRVQQLLDYCCMHQYQRGASVMLDVVREFELTGDFPILKMLSNVVSLFFIRVYFRYFLYSLLHCFLNVCIVYQTLIQRWVYSFVYILFSFYSFDYPGPLQIGL